MQPAHILDFLLLFLRRLPALRDQQPRFRRIYVAVQRIRIALALVVVSLLIGTLGYVLIDRYGWLDAYYMAVITLASVGFDEVHPLSDAGKIFTTFLILFNVGLFAYAISTITSIFAEGGVTALFNDFRMHHKIESLERHTIVCGYGRHAWAVTEELHNQQVEFVVIDNSPAKVDRLREETDFLYVEGDATLDQVLVEAGIRRAAALVTTLPSDADNLFIVLSARQINPGLRIISRASNEIAVEKLQRAGASYTVVPEQIGGGHMATLVYKPDLVRFSSFLSHLRTGDVQFEELLVGRLKPAFQNLTRAEFSANNRVILMAVRRADGEYDFNPAPQTVLSPDSQIVVLGNAAEMSDFLENALAATA
jgi:voltage-gated potassium channel